jgi:hypothetical protein
MKERKQVEGIKKKRLEEMSRLTSELKKSSVTFHEMMKEVEKTNEATTKVLIFEKLKFLGIF